MIDWIREHRELLGWLGVLSVATFVGTLVALPLLVARVPADYFLPRERRAPRTGPVPVVLRALKNLLGVVFIAAGVAMLLLPGQGILTILIGLTLLDFPGKRGLELRLARHPAVRKAIDWIRTRAGRPPIELPP